MIKTKTAVLCACLLLGVLTASAQRIPAKAFLVCGDTKIMIIDYAKSASGTPSVIWEWDAKTAADIPESEKGKFRTMDDCKAIDNGKRLLVSSSSGAIAIIELATRKVVFRADVPNAHSIALLPGNLVAAAASVHRAGNKLMLFDPKKGAEPVFTDTLYSAHGTVWDAARKRLYALGYDVLREYKLAGNALELTRKWTIPGIGGHELMMAPGGRQLFVTEHHGTWKFDIESEKFEKAEGMPDAENMKSLGQDKSGQYIYTIPEESWWTFHVLFKNPDHQIAFPDLHLYKARWFWE